MARMAREKTCALLDLVDDGVLSWESIARAALNYMSEDDVADMARREEFLIEEDEEDEDYAEVAAPR